MTHLVIVILDDLKQMPAILEVWRGIGVPGVTILESAGGHRATSWLARVGLSAIDRLFDSEEVSRRTLLAAIDDEDLLGRAIAEAERVVGGFDKPNTGVLLVLPVAQTRGLRKRSPSPLPYQLPSAVQPECAIRRDTPVEDVIAILNLEPTIVQADTPLDEVSRIMQLHPSVHMVCVVSDEGRLIGLINLQDLVDALFVHIMPEKYLSEIHQLEDVMAFADRSRMRTAADAMQAPQWVKRSDTVREAFKRMHEHNISGLPVVDDQYRVVGYINLLELLAVCFVRLTTDQTDSGEESV
jgi:CBS domain-containing protein